MRKTSHALMVLMLILAISGGTPSQGGNAPENLKIKPIKGRPSKLLHQALYAKDGRLGFLQDVDGDGADDFVHLVQKGSQLSFRIMSPRDGVSRVDVELGKGYPAGLGTVNLDDDAALEFIAAYGSRRDRLAKKALSITISAIFSAVVAANAGYTFIYVSGQDGLDLQDLVALDDDGTILWQRDLRENGEAGAAWDNVRFRMLVPVEQEREAMIILTNNVGNSVLGVSAGDGATRWSTTLPGEDPVARWSSTGLLVDKGIAPVLFMDSRIVVLDAQSGEIKLAEAYQWPISYLPTWETFGKGSDEGFLIHGETRNELQMISLATGKPMWTQEMEKVRAVLPLDQDSFMVVWKHGVRTLAADGRVLQDRATPDKVKTVFDPVFRDLDGDGSQELVFVSGKSIICWNPQKDMVLWRESLASFVGGANPVALYHAFHDMNGDGWLDVPAATGGGAGRWLSGKTGHVIIEVGAGVENPLVGDWDGNGLLELFWWHDWYEVQAPGQR